MKRVTKKSIYNPSRRKNARKGDSGRVLIVGGSEQYAGVLALSGMAALRAGADWVTVAAPERVAWTVESLVPDLVCTKLKGKNLSIQHYKVIRHLLDRHSVLLFGGGAGTRKDTIKLFEKLGSENIMKVIDADGIKALSMKKIKNAIITPHKKEAEIFFGKKIKHTKLFAVNENKKLPKDVVVLIKGQVDYIFDNKQIWYNTTGNPGMAKAGTGDVLAGLVAGYLTQCKSKMKSAITAAFVNGQVGDMFLKKRKGEYSFVASDLVSDYKKYIKIK